MNIRLLSLLLLLYLSSTYCSACTEKTTFEDGEDEYDICSDLSSESGICGYDPKSKRCIELTCDNAPANQCQRFPNREDGKACLPKSDKTGCEYKSCTDLTSNCNQFYTGNDDQICTPNSSGNKCEIKSCSSLTSKCEEFIPYYSRVKCASIREGTCEIVNKECEEYKSDECEEYSSSGDTKCLLDSSTNKCKKFTCAELPKTECSKFKLYEEDKVCAPDGDNCKIKSCTDFSSEICETVEFSYEGYKCTKSSSGCSFTTCQTTNPSNCGKFIPTNKAYKCYLDSDSGKCFTETKDCGELSKGECHLFNTEDNLEDTNGKKCVEDDGKCVLNSKKIEFPAFIILILLFLF